MVLGWTKKSPEWSITIRSVLHDTPSVGGCGSRNIEPYPAGRGGCLYCHADRQAQASYGALCLLHPSCSHLVFLLCVQLYLHWMDGKNYTDVTRKWYGRNIVFPLSLVVVSQLHRRARQSIFAGLSADTPLEQRGIEVCGLLVKEREASK